VGSSVELESLISQHPAVEAVAVVGVPDPQWGEQPLALLVCIEGRQLDAAALAEHLQPFVASGQLNKWAIPRQIRCVGQIPKTSVGKVRQEADPAVAAYRITRARKRVREAARDVKVR
jgi:fatty-acyl-CoA synthase